MKCPVCQAKLLPVDGEMFCLQCGRTLREAAPPDNDNLRLEDTVEPMLQRAIRDAGNYEAQFKPAVQVAAVRVVAPRVAVEVKRMAKAANRVQPVEVARAEAQGAPKRRSFVSLDRLVMAPKPLTSGNLMLAGGESAQVSESAGEHAGAPVRPAEKPEPLKAPKPIKMTQAPLKARTAAGRRTRVRGWLLALAAVVVFAGLNSWAGNYYADRVYPGVKIGSVNVGGWTFSRLSERMPALLEPPQLSALINGREYPLEVKPASVGEEEVLRQVHDLGRQTWLPVAGMAQSMTAGPVRPNYAVSVDSADQAAAQLAAKFDRSASDAFITTLGSNVLIIADKPGVKLDKAAAAAAIRSAYGLNATVSLSTDKVLPKVAAADYAGEKAAAEALIAQTPQIIVRKAHYTPTAAQLASWVIFNGPGKGIAVDPAGVAGFIRGIPGSFDRALASASLTAALNARQSSQIIASVGHITAAPTPPSAAASWPLATYNYCIQASTADKNGLAEVLKTSLAQPEGWPLGGRIKYMAATSGCNFKIQLADTPGMTLLDWACGQQTTCRIHNDLAINIASWGAAPSTWKAGLAGYRVELANQVVGQWLGFDHPSCQEVAAAPVSQVTVNVAGCSPNWYPVPAEVQDTKILAGF